MRLIELKVKVKSLAQEVKIITKEENKQLQRYHACKETHPEAAEQSLKIYTSLHEHRKSYNCSRLRRELRLSGLAYGMLRGRKYRELESTVKKHHLAKPPEFGYVDVALVNRLIEIVGSFSGGKYKKEDVCAWLEAA